MPKNVTVGTVPTLLCEAHKGRKALRIQALNANVNAMYVDSDKVVTSAGANLGIELVPNGIVSMSLKDGDFDVINEWYGIVAAGTETAKVSEVF